MPKYSPGRELLEAEKVSKSLIENGLNASAVARLRGTTPQNECKKARSKPVRDCLKKFLDSPKLKKKLIEVGLKGLEANRTVSAVITGKDAGAADTDFIEVPDHGARHRYWHDLMVACGSLKVSGDNNKGTTVLILDYGYRTKAVDSTIWT